MSDDIPKENPLWPKHHVNLVDEAWKKRLEQLSDKQRTKYFLGEWIDESTAILTTSVDSYTKCDGKFEPIPDTIETSEDFINWVRSEDDRQT